MMHRLQNVVHRHTIARIRDVAYTDDLAAIMWALYSVAKNITPEVKIMAREKLGEWFQDYDSSDLEGMS